MMVRDDGINIEGTEPLLQNPEDWQDSRYSSHIALHTPSPSPWIGWMTVTLNTVCCQRRKISSPHDIQERTVRVVCCHSKKDWLCVLTVVTVLALIVLTWAVIVMTAGHNTESDITYPDLGEIVRGLRDTESKYPNWLRLDVIGKSVENREILSVTISWRRLRTRRKKRETKKPVVWVVCGLHAREWTSPLTCLHFIENILTHMENDSIFQKLEFKLIPVANPDSYVYTMTETGDDWDRLKRKNMADSGCKDPVFNGVDLNRNFPVAFNLSTSCKSYDRDRAGDYNDDCACSNTFGGREPFSEPETRVLRDALTAAETPWLVLGVHGSHGSWLTPYASQSWPQHLELPQEWDLHFLALYIRNNFGISYTTGMASEVIGQLGGTFMDWVYERLHVNRTYVVELNRICTGPDRDDTDVEGSICHFQPPAVKARQEILPAAWGGFRELLRHSFNQDFIRKSGQ